MRAFSQKKRVNSVKQWEKEGRICKPERKIVKKLLKCMEEKIKCIEKTYKM